MLAPFLTPAVSDGINVLRDERALSAGVLVAFSDRDGGVSAPPYHSLNLAYRGGDDPTSVLENRRRVASAGGFDPAAVVLTRQLHGIEMLHAGGDDSGVVGDADGMVALGAAPSPVLGMLSADCAAIALLGAAGIALVHAGWRGLAGGIVARGVRAVAPVLRAWVGPSIRACCYEVGPEVIAAFESARLPVADASHIDIAHGASAALRNEGVEQVAMVSECTACSERYFSYRRDGVTGRQGAFIARL